MIHNRKLLVVIVLILVFLPSFLIVTLSKVSGETVEDQIHKIVNDDQLNNDTKARLILEKLDKVDFVAMKETYPKDVTQLYILGLSYTNYTQADIKVIMDLGPSIKDEDKEDYSILLAHLFIDHTDSFFHAYLKSNVDSKKLNIDFLNVRLKNSEYLLADVESNMHIYELNKYEKAEWKTLISSIN